MEERMSEAPPEGGNDSGETPAAEEFQAITSQDELDKAIGKRLERERAKFSDYTDLQAKAAKLDEIEKANQTEAEKAAARVAELEAELNSVRGESLRLRIAAEHGITDADDISLFLTGSDEETLTKQAERLAARSEEAGKPRSPRPDRNQGRNDKGSASTADQFAATIGGAFS